jgi:Holliday junction resolvase
MPSKNSLRGSTFEREIVALAREQGFRAERAYGSNGKALGEAECVDVLINDAFRIQAKRRKKLAEYLQIPEGADAVVFRQDRNQPLALIPLPTLLALLRDRLP